MKGYYLFLLIVLLTKKLGCGLKSVNSRSTIKLLILLTSYSKESMSLSYLSKGSDLSYAISFTLPQFSSFFNTLIILLDVNTSN